MKSYLSDLIGYLPSKIIPGVFGFISVPILTRLFDPDDYGLYVLVMSTLTIMGIIAIGWIDTSIFRFYAKYEHLNQLNVFNGTLVRLMFLSLLGVTAIVYIIMLFFRSFFTPGFIDLMKIGLLIFIFSNLVSVMQSMLAVKRKPLLYSITANWKQCVCILIGVGLVVIYDTGIRGILLGILLGMIIIIPFLFVATFRKVDLKIYSPLIRDEIIKYGTPLAVTNLLYWVLSLSDRYILLYYWDSSEVGLYSISYNIGDHSLQIIVSLIILSSSPIVMKLWETKGEDETKKFIKGVTKIYLIISIPAALGLSILSKQIIVFLASEEYHDGYRIIPLVAWSIFLLGLQRNYQLSMLFKKKTKLIMIMVLITALVNVILNFVFIPKHGFIAAGYTTLISYGIFTIMMIKISRKYFVWQFPFLTLSRTLLASGVMSLTVIIILSLNIEVAAVTLATSIILAMFVYFTILIVFKEIDIREFMKSNNRIINR